LAFALSRYNVYLEEPQATPGSGTDRLLIFNTLKGALLSVGLGRVELEDLVARADSAEVEPEMAALLGTLRSRGLVIDKDHDELAAFLRTRLEHLEARSVMRLTILATLFCNFRCAYCYESLVGPAMDDETEARLGQFVARSAKTGEIKVLDVNWFGGEPLIEWDRLVRLTRVFREAAASAGTAYQAGLATNGYLLNAARAAALRDELGVRSVVVTLDGPPRVHNRRRVHSSGRATFDRILAGLECLAVEGHNIGLQINCDDSTTTEDLAEVLERLAHVRQAVTLHVRWVFPQPSRWQVCGHDPADGRGSQGVEIGSMNGAGAEKEGDLGRHDRILSLARAAVACGFRVRNPIIRPRVAFCSTEYRNHWVIHPTGDLYKCNVEFELGEPCGTLDDDGRIRMDTVRLERWLNKNPASDERCRDCVWLPVCTGGCAFARRTRSSPPCPHGRVDRLTDYILLEYQQRKGGLYS
jgi:uncharacterized protein